MKTSQIANYLVSNSVKAIKDSNTKGLVIFYNSDGKYVGHLKHNKTPEQSTINIKLYKPGHDHPFIKQLITINRTLRYFLKEKRYMPVKIEVNKKLTDYDKKIIKEDSLGRGLAQNRYIEQIPETDEILKSERIHSEIPNEPVFKINKPFKYESKYYLHNPYKRIDSHEPIVTHEWY